MLPRVPPFTSVWAPVEKYVTPLWGRCQILPMIIITNSFILVDFWQIKFYGQTTIFSTSCERVEELKRKLFYSFSTKGRLNAQPLGKSTIYYSVCSQPNLIKNVGLIEFLCTGGLQYMSSIFFRFLSAINWNRQGGNNLRLELTLNDVLG